MEYDQNFKPKDKVKIGFKLTNENKNNGLFKYNGSLGEYQSQYRNDEHVVECNIDLSLQYFKTVNIIKKNCALLPGEPIVCCADKECNIGPENKKQSFIFCPECSKDSYNFTICQLHASEYEDPEANEIEEVRLNT